MANPAVDMKAPAALCAELRKLLAEVPAINAAYVHGSQARGRCRPDSDLDVALLPFPGGRLAAEELADIAAHAGLAIGRDVDLGVLSTANLVYAREVAANRMVLFEKDAAAASLFFATALGEYADFKVARAGVEKAYASR
jgi:uncharacterized protein